MVGRWSCQSADVLEIPIFVHSSQEGIDDIGARVDAIQKAIGVIQAKSVDPEIDRVPGWLDPACGIDDIDLIRPRSGVEAGSGDGNRYARATGKGLQRLGVQEDRIAEKEECEGA